jgi:hypothetical protein
MLQLSASHPAEIRVGKGNCVAEELAKIALPLIALMPLLDG